MLHVRTQLFPLQWQLQGMLFFQDLYALALGARKETGSKKAPLIKCWGQMVCEHFL